MTANAHSNLDMNVVIGSCPHDTQSLLKTKRMVKSTLNVKIKSKSLEAIKIIGP